MQKKYDVLGIGSALIDIQMQVDEATLKMFDFPKGNMSLIDVSERNRVLATLKSYKKIQASGGSVANTLANMAKIGSITSMIACVADDEFGSYYKKNMIDTGVDFLSNPSTAEGTGTCIVMVTPDAQRTMLTTLGCAPFLEQHHIQESFIAKAKILYIEGYLWDHPETIALVKKAIKIAKKNQVKVAFSASDSFCVNRHKEDFSYLLNNEVDIFFANADETMAITGTDTLEKAINLIKPICDFMAITKDKKGSVIITNKKIYNIASVPCQEVDTTGAGDAYAAGILHGITHNMKIKEMGELASKISSEVVTKMGARH